MNKIILASQSLGRKKLLEYLKIPFTVVSSLLNEEKILGKNPEETIRIRAKEKGEDIAASLARAALANGSATTYILSADSGAILDKELIGKPAGRQQAIQILKKLSGRRHKYQTSIYIIKIDKNKSDSKEVIYQADSVSYVTFRKMTDEDISFYLDRTDFTRFAAAYIMIGAQDFITKIEGSLSNVIGLPLEQVIPVLKREKIL